MTDDISVNMDGGVGGSWKEVTNKVIADNLIEHCLLYTSPSPRDPKTSRMPSSA